MKKYYVYVHTFPNNKKYVGITSQQPTKRWSNGKGYKSNKYMTNAIIKYGWENVKHEIFFNNLTKKEAEQREIELIERFNLNDKKYGYNILKGGDVSNGFTDEVLKKKSAIQKKLWENLEYKEHMKMIHKGKKVSDETKEKMSKSNRRYWLKKHLPFEIKQKISEKKKGSIPWNKGTKGITKPNQTSFKKGEIHSITKKVKCIETKIIYDTINSASRKMNVNATCIINVCKGKQQTAGGLHWKYIN